MAHEGLTLAFVIMGILLIVGYQFGPNQEVREVKRLEAKVMLIPSAIILFVLAAIVFSGILG
ncbi:MAG: hypothetical protein BAJATHORv1_40042 [Candidatus Thorarchaeota archaeon]|nr:MAG: hypothetical protein BAJATHORv1_40042 [Candidatus Thorarchaeota archaeon]